ncbi:hypothetical protein CRG98_015943 [Punica granatum]|uniref:Uncharacterized protein n=1 Tax=Punica granatum TaxID=22663 RepID=A0A2I0K535_PUNGR|nr:hypothetical protein CRG98_015943 [Punica granatum]
MSRVSDCKEHADDLNQGMLATNPKSIWDFSTLGVVASHPTGCGRRRNLTWPTTSTKSMLIADEVTTLRSREPKVNLRSLNLRLIEVIGVV